MSIVFAAVTPHPPLLLPATPAHIREQLVATRGALAMLEEELYVANPNLIVVISPHSGSFADAFTIHGNPQFISFFEEFGDVETAREWKGAPEIANAIAHRRHTGSIPIQVGGGERLDHGASIPLFFLTEHMPHIKILPVGFSALSPYAHMEFGELMRDCLFDTNIRAAIIASGDLSHTLTHNSPAKFNPRGKEFDRLLMELLGENNSIGIANIDPSLVSAADECGYRSILIALGALKNSSRRFKTLSYEFPFGVGYLTGIFH